MPAGGGYGSEAATATDAEQTMSGIISCGGSEAATATDAEQTMSGIISCGGGSSSVSAEMAAVGSKSVSLAPSKGHTGGFQSTSAWESGIIGCVGY